MFSILYLKLQNFQDDRNCPLSKELPQCPENFTEAQNFCYKLSSPSQYPPECPFKDVLPFDTYKDVITEPVWMPVLRNLSNGLGYLYWTEFSSLYKVYFDLSYQTNKKIKDKNCLVYYNESYIVAVSCNETFPRICAYNKVEQLSNQLCPSEYKCSQSDFSPKSTCFCVDSNSSQTSQPKAEFLKPYQNNIYNSLTDDICGNGLLRTKNGFIWASSQQNLTYTYWSAKAIFDNNFIYGASSCDGWILTARPVSCTLFQIETENFEPKLDLTFESSFLTFTLNVSDFRGLKVLDLDVIVYCFTDALNELLYRYPSLEKISGNENWQLYKFSAPDTLGHYWCESVRYLDMQVIKSSEYHLENYFNSSEFVAIFSLIYNETINPLSQDLEKLIQNNIYSSFGTYTYIKSNYVWRFMKIVDLDEDTNTVWVNIHFTSLDLNDLDDQGKFYTLKNLLSIIFNSNEVPFVDFLNSRFCQDETTEDLTWPLTKAGQTANPYEYCFDSEANLVTRLCKDNFIDGAKWSSFNNCTIADYTNVSKTLISCLNDTNKESVEQVVKLSAEKSKFGSLDVYLIAKIFKNALSVVNSFDMFIETINNIMNFDRKILRESQVKMKSTDFLLDLLYEEIQKNPLLSKNKSNIIVQSNTFEEVSAVVLLKSGTFLTIKSPNCSIDTNYNNFEWAFWIGEGLCSRLEPTSRVTFVIFLNNALFQEEASVYKSAQNIFYLVVPEEFNDLNDGTSLVRIFNQLDSDSYKQFCSFWKYDREKQKGAWKITSQIDVSSFQFCDYTSTVQFPLAVTIIADSENITESLLDLIESNYSNIVIMEKLSEISKKYENFTSTDVYLLSQVLEKVSQDDSIVLANLGEVVNNLVNIDQKILSASQEENSATDLVLQYIDVIIKNHKYENRTEVVTDNFKIMISDIQETNFTGLAVFNSNHTMQILDDDDSMNEMIKTKNFECIVALSSDLRNQLVSDTKIRITVFSSRVLFNEQNSKSTSSNVSTIFGVILPEIENYSGPINVFHKISSNNSEKNCVYWDFNENSTGFWRKDSEGSGDDLIQCQFWHTTHFALLLFDKDMYRDNYGVLDKITAINCVISGLGLSGIVLTAILFKKWRSNKGNVILLNFAFALILQIAAFYVSNSVYRENSSKNVCVTIGVVLHYSTVSEFCWMLVIAFLQFRRFVKVLQKPVKRLLLKSCLFGWFLPVVPVITVLFFNSDSYIASQVGLCYPSGFSLYLGVWLPIIVILFFNIIFFSKIMYSVSFRKSERVCTSSNSDFKYQMRLLVLLFFKLGLTWFFGLLALLNFGKIFDYLFTITTTIQGFVLFLYFILFNSETRKLYLRALKKLRFCYSSFSVL